MRSAVSSPRTASTFALGRGYCAVIHESAAPDRAVEVGGQVLKDAAGSGQARLSRPAVHWDDPVPRQQPWRHIVAEVGQADPPVRADGCPSP